MKRIINKLIIIFLFMQPFLDVLTSFQIRFNILNIYISSIIRIVFLLFILIYMIIYKYDLKIILFMFIYGIIYGGYLLATNSFSLAFDAIRIFYLPVMIIFFNNEDIKIDKKKVLILYLIYMLLLLIPTMFGFSFDIYEVEKSKKGFIGLFYGGNELSGILLGLLPIILNYLQIVKKYYFRIIYYILIIFTFILVSTKTLFIGGILVLLIYLFKYILNKKTVNKKYIIGGIVGVLVFLVIALPYTPVMNNIKVTLDYYGINNITDMFNLKTIDNVIYSRRLSYASNLIDEYKNSPIDNKLFGLKNINNIKDSELDLIDTYMTIGLIGFIVYLIVMGYLLYKYRLKGIYLFSLILFIIMACLSGHILIKPAVAIYTALIFRLNKEVE